MSIRTRTHTLPLKESAEQMSRRGLLTALIPRTRKRLIRYVLVVANVALLLSAVAFVLNSPSGTTQIAQNSALITDDQVANPLDQLSASDIAVHVAQMNNLPEATAVIEQADTISGQLALSSSDSQVAARPQVVSTDARSYRDIQVYVTKPGDTVASLATQFGVTSDSIIWSNNLSGNELEPNRELYIPPVNGIVYLVQAGDTVDKLARDFQAEAAAIVAFNDAEVRGLPVGQRVVIPGGSRAPAVTRGRSIASGGTWGSSTLTFAGNTYTKGYCTWHVYNKRAASGNPIPNNLGNAISWYRRAVSGGLPVGNTPRDGAVLWHANIGGLGHVAYVERVNPDGSIYVSDMNYPLWNKETHRTVPPSEFGNYRFIY